MSSWAALTSAMALEPVLPDGPKLGSRGTRDARMAKMAECSFTELLPLEVPASDLSREYLRTKKKKLGHRLSSV